MAIKTFKCVICEADVTKPQSYAFKDGRACRHHPEVQQNHESQEQAKKADLEKHKEKPRGFFHERSSGDPYEALKAFGIKNPNEHCWCCHKDGVYEHILYERYLINMSKLELRSEDPVSIFEVTEGSIGPNKKLQEMLKEEFGEVVPLRRIEVAPEFPNWKLNQVIKSSKRNDKQQLVRMTGMIVLCKDCATKFEFPWLYARDKGISIENMLLVGSLVKPVFDSVAAGEIAAEEINNIYIHSLDANKIISDHDKRKDNG
jgi:hypothetical protein